MVRPDGESLVVAGQRLLRSVEISERIAAGAILVVLVTILGPISGGHFNPAVSLVFAMKR
jgi:glycerol uptake facilitator-like aquaporin